MPGKSDEKRALQAERKRREVYFYEGDDINPPGEVNLLGKAGHGERVVQRVGTEQQFTVKMRTLTKLAEQPAEEEEPETPA